LSSKVVVVTDASSGLGWLSVEALALAGHTVYAAMRDVSGHNASRVEAATYFAKDNGVDLRSVEMDVRSTLSVDAAVDKIFNANGRIDVVVHNATQTVFGPAEAFTPDQLAQHLDVNVVSTQRVNRALLPHMRRQKHGVVVWISGLAGATQPYLAANLAAQAAMDSMAVGYARELTRWGIETSIIVPGSFVAGGNHFAQAGSPADTEVVAEYEAQGSFDGVFPSSAGASSIADILVRVIEAPSGQRPFRIHAAPTDDGQI
jgi:NAD(P)-dependent dehydrogenase (short-subunit alcohol dehydrogenase family)